ncbi:MAG TPA: beta-N-acetylhexosaminidase [Myxococcota bacterium]|nr:beta-N-acetylhexosaminidase [Myxococcota bacterium]
MADRVTAVGEATSLADRKRRAGQRVILGFEHPWVDPELRRIVREIRPAGYILFARNVEDPAQVRELTRELASLADPRDPAIVCVDQEGGRVQRVRAPATVWPPMRAVGQADGLTADVSRALAVELHALGFHLNLAPVADVDSNPANPVIGDRAFARDAREVARHVAAFVAAHQAAGVIACAKHFPGHGDTHVDSHLDLPVVEEELPRLLERELLPFAAAVRAGVGAVMSAHVVFPALDEAWPATLSERVIPELLRGRLGYDGVVLSDDMEMKAVHGRWDTATLTRRATLATVDVLLCCRSHPLQLEVFRDLVQAQEEDKAQQKLAEASVRRVHALRERFLLERPPQPGLEVVGAVAHKVLAEQVRQRGA